jgi:para-nitrobenzyl esterase
MHNVALVGLRQNIDTRHGRLTVPTIKRIASTAFTIACALTIAASGSIARAGNDRGADDPVAQTTAGRVRGAATPTYESFLGLPYAAPPVRDLRFAPPAAPPSWAGTRAADRQSPACLQFEPTGIREEQAVSEDCLYLDLYRPRQRQRGAKLPVLVWFHGGGNTQGTGVIYGGGTPAARTGTIVISINYRLGALGFLAHPALSAATPGGSGNYGLMDQLASLRWVRANAANFGGDPSTVTIYGQSAGGGGVCNLLAVPSAKGLFHKAIVQSSACLNPRPTLAAGEQTGLRFAESVGCTEPSTVVGCLRKAWPGRLIANQANYQGGPKVGGAFFPRSPADAIGDGTWNAVPLLTGSTRSENRLLSTALAGITAQGYVDRVNATYGDRAPRVLELYPLDRFRSPYDAITQVQTDAGTACRTELTARATTTRVPTYRYEFDDPTSPTLGERPLTAEQRRLADQMMRYWGAFAHNGNPNHRGAPAWPVYGAEQTVMQLRTGGASTVVTTFATDHNCGFWLA